MNIIEKPVAVFLRERILENNGAAGNNSFADSKFFELILRGEAKLPLDRVEEVADLLACDKQQLFRMAIHQFYDQKAIALLERMLGEPMTAEEQKWLHVVRSAADGPVPEPSGVAKRLVRALVRPQASVATPG